VKGQKGDGFPRIVTCPNEMVAMSMADGYARLTGKPQCVLVHVDVGTQGLGAAVHNASTGRCPVLIFAGLSPFTCEGELRGSRTEYIHWIQDVPDQKQIVAQYCRYTAEIKTGRNIKQMVRRALQFATSAPMGPVYLCAAREVLEEEIEEYGIIGEHWDPIAPAALSEHAVQSIAKALWHAKEPLVITGYSGRNHAAAQGLVDLANTVKGLRVLDTGGSDMCFPADHPGWLSLRYGIHDAIKEADVILIFDCDVPWIPTQCHPSSSAKIYHIDVDPLKQQMPLFYIPAVERYRADSNVAVSQIREYIDRSYKISIDKMDTGGSPDHHISSDDHPRWKSLVEAHSARKAAIEEASRPKDDGSFGTGHLCRMIRKLVPQDAIFVVEAVTNAFHVADSIQATLPGSWINCGGGGLGWSGGAALGIKLATEYENRPNPGKFVVQIVGDGTYLFSVPSSVYWISQRYHIPILTIVLNNNGWNAPRKSLLLVHPDGLGSKVTNEELNISLANPIPDFAGIARAASGGAVFAEKVARAVDLEAVLGRAIEAVLGGTSAVVDAVVV